MKHEEQTIQPSLGPIEVYRNESNGTPNPILCGFVSARLTKNGIRMILFGPRFVSM